ncbi:acetate--CoA ligase family protein [Mesorhizobium sp. PUT5]|uniref:acetate--CoA ligase family protein n=1 Tax=Mesorhizobium sp. PUT5 TaxID=3454629 RepID=UPI003FA428BB
MFENVTSDLAMNQACGQAEIVGRLMDALLKPQSVALIGASSRQSSNGLAMVEMSRIDGYKGRVYPINPNYSEIDGLKCYPSLDALPETVDLVVLAIANANLEEAFDGAVAHGAKAITVFGSAFLDNDVAPALAQRLKNKAVDAGIVLCGPNSMGLYNPGIGLRIAGFPSPEGLRAGGIAFVAQSGSAFSALAHNERRLGFTVCVSSGSELGATAADYIEWSLQQPETRVIGLFLEQMRNPKRFANVLDRASSRDIPVVILKVGRTAKSAQMALSHTGALTGNDQSFLAFCRKYGAVVVEDLDEFAATLQFFDQPRRLPEHGAFASMHDSGGERELTVDIAERLNVEYAEISSETRGRIQPFLDPGLHAENPLDAWGTPGNFVERYEGALNALLADENVGTAVFFSDIRDDYWYSAGVAQAVLKVAMKAAKPVAIATNYSKTTNSELALALAREGVPVIEGTREALLAYRHASHWRNRPRHVEAPAPHADATTVQAWRTRLSSGNDLSEHEGLRLLAHFGVRAVETTRVANLKDACDAASKIGYPVVLKTATGHAHKSDVGGVRLNLKSAEDLQTAYGDLCNRLGPEVLVSAMAAPGVEIGLGAVVRDEMGPLVVVSAGGVLIEHLKDSNAALAPISAAEALDLLKGLRIYPLLEGVRGNLPADIESLATLIERFSVLVTSLSDVISEIDVNPVIANASGAVAVDALVVAKPRKK